ncbi:unnamed protein product [Adineta steineri]|uniref:SGNH hydrolase-type esterase domain-containing protein n=1 Tax=Adineta steineri TaxID=433720 RepID=A0A814SXN8_9BILA|nr:unnamed protein product [Adineta steineri]CAF1340607.1 unnamed protein product [Adineta steineri]
MLSIFSIIVCFNLIVSSYQQGSGNLIVGFGDSMSASGAVGGYSKSYTMIAANLLGWSSKNFAKDGVRTTAISGQLSSAASILPGATHVVFTIGGNDLGVANSLVSIILHNNYTAVAQKVTDMKPRLISTYKLIQSSVPSSTRIYVLPYVDFISVGNKIPNEHDCHRLIDHFTNIIKEAADEVHIGFIADVKTAFAGHEVLSTDPYADDYFHPKNAAHPNAKGYAKIGEVVANYLRSQ